MLKTLKHEIYDEMVGVYERIENDINGNPIYLVAVLFNGHHIFVESIKRGRKRKDRKYRIQSYDIQSDVRALLNEYVQFMEDEQSKHVKL